MKNLNFGTLYIKPAFLFQDDDGAVKLQFEADAYSALGYLYDNMCKMLGLSWNYESPSNSYGYYTNCAMHAAGDRATYGCGPDNTNNGGFCPQMTIAYRVAFQSDDHAAAFFYKGNSYVDYWRSLYPNGVAVGTNNFCKDGGCLGLFLNRYDLYQVFKPDLGGSWVEYNGATAAPTISPAPTAKGGCDNPHNSHLDKCFKRNHPRGATAVAWQSLGPVGQLSVFLVSFMSVTLSLSIFLARARKRRRRGESYLGFMIRDMRKSGRGGKKRRGTKSRKKKSRSSKSRGLSEDLLGDKSRRSKSKSRSSSKKRSSSSGGDRKRSSSSKHRSSSSSKHRSSSSKRDGERKSSSSSRKDGESRRSSSKHRSSSKDRSSRRSSSGSRSRSKSKSGRTRSAHPDKDEMSKRQLV